MTDSVIQIPLASILPSPFNPRKRFDPAALDDLQLRMVKRIEEYWLRQVGVRPVLSSSNLALPLFSEFPGGAP